MLAAGSSSAQELSSIGTDFWLGFMPNTQKTADHITLLVSSLYETGNKLIIEYFGGGNGSASKTTIVVFSKAEKKVIDLDPILAETRKTETVDYQAIHIHTEKPVSLYGYSYRPTTAEGFLALPTTMFGKNYYAVCQIQNEQNSNLNVNMPEGEFLIIAPYDSTRVTITSSSCTRKESGYKMLHKKNDSWQVVLMKGQTYLVRASADTLSKITSYNLTGSFIRSDKPVAFISGHEGVDNDGENGGGYVAEMLPPIESWQSTYNYLSLRTPNPSSDPTTTLLVVAGDSNITLMLNGQIVAFMSKGSTKTLDYYQYAFDGTISTVNNKPIQIMEFRYGYGYFYADKGHEPPFHSTMSLVPSADTTLSFIPIAQPVDYDTIPPDSHGTDGRGYWNFVGSNRYSPEQNIPLIIKPNGDPMLCGKSLDASYAFPAVWKITKHTADTTKPFAVVTDLGCGEYDVMIKDTAHGLSLPFEAGKLAEARFIADTSDPVKPSVVSHNFICEPIGTFHTGDSLFHCKLHVGDLFKPANAHIYAQDFSGNELHVFVTNNALGASLEYEPTFGYIVGYGKQACFDRVYHYKKEAGPDTAVTVVFAELAGADSSFVLQGTIPALPAKLYAGDSLVVRYCVNAPDTGIFHFDTLIVHSLCVNYSVVVSAMGKTGLLVAQDLHFPDLAVGEEKCLPMNLFNEGDIPLTVTGAAFIDTVFSLDASITLPFAIAPRSLQKVTLCYSPNTHGVKDSAIVNWQTDLIAPFDKSIKTYSILKGAAAGTSSVEDSTVKPLPLAITALYPNPANSVLHVSYQSEHASTIKMYDINGKPIYEKQAEEGMHSISIAVKTVAAGNYRLVLRSGIESVESAVNVVH
jgi:hypothetical protein